MEGDQITYSDKGTPQGGTISPCLANVFLHHVLDEWFVREVKPRMRGHCFVLLQMETEFSLLGYNVKPSVGVGNEKATQNVPSRG
jgi:hypothetical protein